MITLNLIEEIINKMNCTFEFYFEDFPDIDSSDIWWYYDSESKNLKHICNKCEKAGDLAVHYYRHGYCAIYATMLQELFPEGIIFQNEKHMIFYYQGEYYDASGKLDSKEITYEPYLQATQDDIKNFLNNGALGFSETKSNLKLREILMQEGKNLLKENRSLQRKIEIN